MLRRELLFWSRLVRYHASKVGAFRMLDANRIKVRLLGQMALLALLVAGGYLVGRESAPGCAPVANAACTEAQALPAAAPTPAALERQAVVVVEPLWSPTPDLPATSQFHPAAAAPSQSPADVIPSLPEKKTVGRPAALSNDEIREMQAWLKAFGFDPGPIDGYPGARTMAAVKRYQAARQAEATGQLDRSFLRKVRRDAGHS